MASPLAAAEVDLPAPPAAAGAGKPLRQTMLFYARWLTEHERPHIKQAARIVEAVTADRAIE